MGVYSKAIAAFLTSAVTFFAVLGVDFGQYGGAEFIGPKRSGYADVSHDRKGRQFRFSL